MQYQPLPPATPMGKIMSSTLLTQVDVYRFLRRALFRLKWATIAVLFLITLMQPSLSSLGLPTWSLLVLFAAYNLLVELSRRRLPEARALTLAAVLDLPMVGVLYFLAAEPGGPLFVLFFLAVDYAAASLTLRGTLLYTAAAATVAIAIDLTLSMWSMTGSDVRMMVARLVMLTLVGIGMAIVTRRLVMEQEAARAVQDTAVHLEELDRLRSQFVSNVSHELRTPLTAVRAGLGLLEASAIDRLRGEEAELLDNARRNVERLNVLIDDLLAHNQLEAGTLGLEREHIDLRTVVMAGVSAVRSLVQEKRQRLELDLPVPLPLSGDPGRLEQMVVNLLANAHRHTPAGTHILIAGRLKAGDVHLTVSDDGPGIPLAELDGIFQRFHHLTSADSSSGLGLAIARAIAELHGGRVWAESGLVAGVAFCVALPGLAEGAE